MSSGRYRPEQCLRLQEIAEQYDLNHESVLKVLAEFRTLGMITLFGDGSAVVHPPNLKEMQEAYEIRAGLEEVSGRAAAAALKGNTATLQKELNAMRAAFNAGDLEGYAEHDVQFHRKILKASENSVLLRVWDTLAFDVRIRVAIAKVSRDLPEVESHQPIINALENGRAREAGLLLRNHVETFSEYLKKSDSDSGIYRAFRKDLESAKDIQQAFFPPESLSIPGLSCETFYKPAHEIGGDYYDFFSLPNGRWGIAIGDVSGKGIGAALIMASLQASLRAQALHPHMDLSTLVGNVNRLVYESSPTHLFVSLFYAEYEPATRILKYVNAGHNSPMVVRLRNGSCEIFQLKCSGMPVAISIDSQFTSTTFQLEIGDLLVAYTDGITEADNPRGEFWGVPRLENLLRVCSRKNPKDVIKRILDEGASFAAGLTQRDDMTLMVMRVQAQ